MCEALFDVVYVFKVASLKRVVVRGSVHVVFHVRRAATYRKGLLLTLALVHF